MDSIQNFGIFSANGKAMIVEIPDQKMNVSTMKIFFKPFNSSCYPLRVKPATTNVYGPIKQVFVIPPAPNQWTDTMHSLLLQRGTTFEDVKIALFYEKENMYKLFGTVTYRFWNSTQPNVQEQIKAIGSEGCEQTQQDQRNFHQLGLLIYLVLSSLFQHLSLQKR